MIRARHVSALPTVSKNTGWSFVWTLAIRESEDGPSIPATLPDATIVKLGLRRRAPAVPPLELDCDGFVSRDGAVIRVDVPRAVTETADWAVGSYDGQLRVIDPAEPVDLWEILFVVGVAEGIGE